MNNKDPTIALIAVLDKQNKPILIKNYLVDTQQAAFEESYSPKVLKLQNEM
jgi:hypothetical protein